jgi:putative ABC transport system permease protein
MLSELLYRLRALFRRNSVEAETDEELRAHIERQTDKYVQLGMSREEALRKARIEFGGVEQVKEEIRDARGVTLIETTIQDIRYALRTFLKNPGFTAVAVIALALGIGANTAVFSSINAMLLKPFPFTDLDRIVVVSETAPAQSLGDIRAASGNFRDWREQGKSFESLAAGHGWNVNLTGEGFAERIEGFQVTSDFFHLLGVAPLLGRAVNAGDFGEGKSAVVVLSHGFWQRNRAGDPAIVGKTLRLNGGKFTVVGVMPDEFDFPVGAQAWAPLDLSVEQQADRGNHYLQVLGRLKPGVSREQAREDLAVIAARLAREYPQTNGGHSVEIKGLVESLAQGSRQFLGVLMGAAVFVLLLACANVANLQLARATARRKEIAVRAALGATRTRIARQLLMESVLLSLAGGVAGALLANWGVELSRRSIPPFIVQHIIGLKHLEMDSRVLAFTLFVAVLSGVLSGLAGTVQLSRPDLNEALKQGRRTSSSDAGHHRLRALLVVSEVALALVLLVSTGLMITGFHNLLNAYPGYDRSNVLTFNLALPESQYSDKQKVRSFYDDALRRMRSLPGVEAAACVSSLPSTWSWSQVDYAAEGQPPAAPGELRLAVSQSASPDIFRTLRIPLRSGRLLGSQDGADAPPVVVISQTLAQRIWPDQDALGKRIRFGPATGDFPWRTVVGVVGDIRQSPFDEGPHPTAYFPFEQLPQAATSLALRTNGDPLALAAAARAQVRDVDPNQPMFDTRSLEQIVSDNLSGVKNAAGMMLVFGIIALSLAASGIFAVMAYFVSQRTHEIGVRMALGAQRADVLRMVAAYSGKQALLGLGIGVALSVALTQALSSLLFGIFRLDTPIFVLLTLLLALVAALAAYLPARWATKVDPMVALRFE